MHRLQPQHFLERIEIVIAVQKLIPSKQAECRDPAVDGFADGVTSLAQRTVVLRGCNSDPGAASREYLERQKFIAHTPELARVTNSLQYFAEDQIGKPQSLACQFTIKPSCFRVPYASDVINPNRRVYDDHTASLGNTPLSRYFEISFPFHLATKPPYANLRARLDQQAKASLNSRFLRACPAKPHGLPHQAVVNVNIGPHSTTLLMCNVLIFVCIMQISASLHFPPFH